MLMSFVAGKRLCAGETFARNKIFLTVTSILQNFNLKPDGDTLPDLNQTSCGLIRIPDDFWLKLEAR